MEGITSSQTFGGSMWWSNLNISTSAKVTLWGGTACSALCTVWFWAALLTGRGWIAVSAPLAISVLVGFAIGWALFRQLDRLLSNDEGQEIS
jgi:hypothetical protein